MGVFKLVHVIGYLKYLTKIVHLSELSLKVLENILCNLKVIYTASSCLIRYVQTNVTFMCSVCIFVLIYIYI